MEGEDLGEFRDGKCGQNILYKKINAAKQCSTYTEIVPVGEIQFQFYVLVNALYTSSFFTPHFFLFTYKMFIYALSVHALAYDLSWNFIKFNLI